MRVLNELTTEFRDPALWVVLSIVVGRASRSTSAWVLVDGDLVRHDGAERAIESDLAAIYARLGRPITAPDPTTAEGQAQRCRPDRRDGRVAGSLRDLVDA